MKLFNEIEHGDGPREVRDGFSQYMEAVGKVALLSPSDEIELGGKIQKGDDSAREKMICANLRLVIKIAREYENLGLPLLDLINEGNVGLMRAVDRFDPTKGVRFSTYGAWWIRQSVRRAVTNQSKTIRLPIYVVDRLGQMTRVAAKLKELLGREPADEEVATEMGISLRRVTRLRKASINTTSLDAPVGPDRTLTWAEWLKDENSVSPSHLADTSAEMRRLSNLLTRLPPRESFILKLRYGLDDGQEQTLEEIGGRMGVTRERIRQLQNTALRKLRKMYEKPSRATA